MFSKQENKPMRKASILKIIRNTSVAVGLGAMGLFGSVAHADTFNQRLQAELNSGKDYSAAVAEASRETGSLYAPDQTSDRALSALNQGKDYSVAFEDANRSASAFSPEQVAKAESARAEINEGKDYASAWEDRSEQPAAPVQTVAKDGNGAATRSMK